MVTTHYHFPSFQAAVDAMEYLDDDWRLCPCGCDMGTWAVLYAGDRPVDPVEPICPDDDRPLAGGQEDRHPDFAYDSHGRWLVFPGALGPWSFRSIGYDEVLYSPEIGPVIVRGSVPYALHGQSFYYTRVRLAAGEALDCRAVTWGLEDLLAYLRWSFPFDASVLRLLYLQKGCLDVAFARDGVFHPFDRPKRLAWFSRSFWSL